MEQGKEHGRQALLPAPWHHLSLMASQTSQPP